MCGRYSLYSDPEVLVEEFGLASAPESERRYNISPGSDVTVIGLSRAGERRASLLRWGLIPAWARDPRTGAKMINARAETITEKPAFREAFQKRRCLIPADGFFEWQRRNEHRVPWYIHRRDGRPTAFAGLWEQWKDRETGERIVSCTIITTRANATIATIHARMPVIVERDEYDTWLEAEGDPLRCLVPARDDLLETYRVAPRVNNPRHEGADCIHPLAPED